MENTARCTLLIIDAQVDFCSPEGALFVPGAEQDIQRLARLISTHADQIGQIIATLDTHQVLDIAHPGFWENADGQPPAAFTPISYDDICTGKWLPRFETEYCKTYVRKLEEQGEFTHFIWPEHCLAGSRGAALAEPIATALVQWTHQTQKNYRTLAKGENPLSEHFGVFQAQIPVENAPETELNLALLNDLTHYEEIWIGGEARSHCVATSLKQILRHAPALAPKITLLTDCTSDVPGLGHLADPIYETARQQGVRFLASTDL
ncbi:cysteine hydrolase family protein [Arundinibacter roseus]|uniref:Nicotinamidase n=1 Tax=Arundinibacter roseus TaxID=2070510 RepID=A0A4R4KL48_9BACT|nr:nicotinamidase [Arundinibacter roseus]TDB68958.1 nicotinamidase [Arundinibacter roseus]